MIRINSGCDENAIGMLRGKHSRFLGWIGDIRYYILDGKVWSHTLGGHIGRSDDPQETDRIVRLLRELAQKQEGR